MNARQRRKLFAGAGLISMLVGALMVVAPTAGADQGAGSAGGGNEDCPAGTTQVAKFNLSGGSYVEEGGPGPVDILEGADAQGGSWTSTQAIAAVVVKGGTDAKIVDVTGDGLSGTFNGTGLVNNGGQQPAISNVKFCAGEPTQPRTGSVTVVKKVTGDVPDAWSFDFVAGGADMTISGTSADPTRSELRGGLDGGTSYTVGEKAEQVIEGFEYVGFECRRDVDQAIVDSGDATDREANVQVLAAENITCTFTNHFPDEPDVTIAKAAVPGTVIPTDRPFTYDDPFEATFVLTVGNAHLDEDVPDFEGGLVYTEVPDTLYPLDYITCGDLTFDDVDPQEEIVALAAASIEGVNDPESGAILGVRIWPGDSDVSCTFFNEGDVPPPPPPPPPTPQDRPQSIQVVKTNVGAVPSDWSVDSEIDGPADRGFNLSNGAGPSATSAAYSLGEGTYVISEAVLGLDEELTSSLLSLTCTEDGVAFTGFTRVGDDARVVLGDGDTVVCTFVNSYTQVAPSEVERASIVIDKAVQGPAPSSWSFGFAGTGGIADFDLTDAAPSKAITVDEGTYTITEAASTDAELTAINCGDAVVDVDLDARSVTFQVDGGETVSCTFRNRYPTPPTTAPPTEVAGDVVTRQLPRTGSESTDLAGYGAGLLLLGAGLIVISRAHRYSMTS